MVNYDSDSSEGEQEVFTETNVLLGYASKDSDDDTISRLGGQPEWFDPSKPPSAALVRCKVCKDMMVLLLQLNGELPERFPGHERRLYVFACKRKSCRRKEGSIRVLRGVRIEPGSKRSSAKKSEKKGNTSVKREEAKAPTNLGETLFGAKGLGTSNSANPFSTSGSPSSNPFASSGHSFCAPTNESKSPAQQPPEETAKLSPEEALSTLPKTFAETLSLNNPQAEAQAGPAAPWESWPQASDLPSPYPISYLSEADYETLDPTPPPIPQATVRMDVDEPGSSSSGGKEDKEVYESSMDADFQKFADRIAQNPEQVIRYEFGGQPLLYSKTDMVGQMLKDGKRMSRCGNCGNARTFEVQMTPNAIAELEADELSLEGMDWGTIIVGVCEADCQERRVKDGEAGYLEEWAGVQWEELSAR